MLLCYVNCKFRILPSLFVLHSLDLPWSIPPFETPAQQTEGLFVDFGHGKQTNSTFQLVQSMNQQAFDLG